MRKKIVLMLFVFFTGMGPANAHSPVDQPL